AEPHLACQAHRHDLRLSRLRAPRRVAVRRALPRRVPRRHDRSARHRIPLWAHHQAGAGRHARAGWGRAIAQPGARGPLPRTSYARPRLRVHPAADELPGEGNHMSVASYIFGIVSALLVLIVVIELLRLGRLRERHAIWWLIAGTLALIAGIFPETLTWAASLVGVEVPANLVFFVSVAVLFLVCLQHSAELTKLESKTRILAERVALIELELREREGEPR